MTMKLLAFLVLSALSMVVAHAGADASTPDYELKVQEDNSAQPALKFTISYKGEGKVILSNFSPQSLKYSIQLTAPNDWVLVSQDTSTIVLSGMINSPELKSGETASAEIPLSQLFSKMGNVPAKIGISLQLSVTGADGKQSVIPLKSSITVVGKHKSPETQANPK